MIVITELPRATITDTTKATLAFDATILPGESYRMCYTNDGQIPDVLARNVATGGANVFENGATFSDSTVTRTYNGNERTISLLDITHS